MLFFFEIDKYTDFYKSISTSVMCFPTLGTKSVVNIDTYVFSSIQGTTDSIKVILKIGRINDAYALLRKYYDSVIINIYSNLYLKDNFSIDNFIVEKINHWLQGKEKLPEYRVMSEYIRNHNDLQVINSSLYSNDNYKKIRNRCNDHTHFNSFNNLLLNDKDVFVKNRLSSLDTFSNDIRDIFILHLSYMFYINDHYMISSDYVDYLDCGMQPPEDSQYWVATFVQEVFDEILSVSRSDIVNIIKSNSSMHLA
jgi:hypothetical protein